MELLIQKSLSKLNDIQTVFKRYLYHEIDFSDRLIAISGARGTGKTTIILQYLKEKDLPLEEKLYISLDDVYFANNRLVDLVRSFVLTGGKLIAIDEVHKYPSWSKEIKNIYDDYPELQVIFTSSSILQITKGQADLSRRVVIYELVELSLREYCKFNYDIDLTPLSLKSVLEDHGGIAVEICSRIKPVKLYKEYLEYGAYPFFKENIRNYHLRLESVIQTIIETDIPAVFNINYQSTRNLKKLLYIISSSVPFTPNVADLSRETSIARDTLLKYLELLEKAKLIMLLKSRSKGLKSLAKPDKIYLGNSNLMYALSGKQVNIETARETFFMNQIRHLYEVNFPDQADFLVDGRFLFELGGKSKSGRQIKNTTESYIVSDDIETGFKNKIPLYLFGMLY